jgi:hypothetical protein
MTGWLMNNEVEEYGRKSHGTVLSWHIPLETEENHRNPLSQQISLQIEF